MVLIIVWRLYMLIPPFKYCYATLQLQVNVSSYNILRKKLLLQLLSQYYKTRDCEICTYPQDTFWEFVLQNLIIHHLFITIYVSARYRSLLCLHSFMWEHNHSIKNPIWNQFLINYLIMILNEPGITSWSLVNSSKIKHIYENKQNQVIRFRTFIGLFKLN